MQRARTLLWAVGLGLATTLVASAEDADVLLAGTLTDVSQTQVFIDEKPYQLATETKIRNFDGRDEVSALRADQPVRFRLSSDGRLNELWAYPTDPAKARQGFPNPTANH